MPLSQTKQSDFLIQALNSLLFIGGFIALFFLQTNGIPLIQMGWLPELAKKSQYVSLTRIVLIGYAGLVTFSYLFLRSNFKDFDVVKLVSAIKLRYAEAFIVFLCVGFWFAFILIGFAQTQAFETRAFDLGIFAQAVWNTLHGNFLYSSLKEGICLLGDHFSPILLLTVPFYKLWPDPRILLILQALATSINIFLIYRIAYLKTGSKGTSLLFAFLYLFFRATRGPLREDFHPEMLSEPFMLAAFLYLEKNKLVSFLICTLLVMAGKENMLGVSFILGFYAAVFKKRRLFGIALMFFSVLIFFAETRWWIPAITGKPYFYQAFYKNSAGAVTKHLLSKDSLEYLLKLFGPFSFLPFFYLPTLVLTFPILFQNLLSEGETFRSLSFHYVAGLTPLVLISSIYGFQFLKSKISLIGKNFGLVLGIITIVFLVQLGPSEYYYLWQITRDFSAEKEIMSQKLAEIGPEYSVLTHNGVIPHVVNRKHIYQFGYNLTPGKAEQTVMVKPDLVVLFGKTWEPNTKSIREVKEDLVKIGYEIQYQNEEIFILNQKKQTSGSHNY